MSVVSWREILPRTFSHSFGGAIECERTFALTLDGPTGTQECLDTVGVKFGNSHPEYPGIYCINGDLTETDFYHAELTVSYGIIDPNAPNSAGASGGSGSSGGSGGSGGGGGEGGGTGDDGNGPILNPLARPDVWNFSSSTAEIPCNDAWNDGPNSTRAKPGSINYANAVTKQAIVNTVGDHMWSGVTKTVGQTKATIKANRAVFSWSQAQAVTGKINAFRWLDSAPGMWMCTGISGTPQAEVVGEARISFWEINVELTYREGGFILPLINEGLNYMGFDATKGKLVKRRAFVSVEGMPEPGVPTEMPIALHYDGTRMREAQAPNPNRPAPYIEPLLLYYRVNGSCNFAEYFGDGPPGGIFPVA